MKTASPFERLSPIAERVEILVDGQPITAEAGEMLAGALLAAGLRKTRNTPVSGAPRSPFCMMGACYECLVEIDGVSVQACMTPVSAGMKVTLIKGRPEKDHG